MMPASAAAPRSSLRILPWSGHPRAVDWLLAAYNLVMIGRWAPLVPQHEAARWLVAVHAIALGVPWLLARGGAPAPDQRWLSRFYDLYPLAWLCAFWRELDVHGRFVSNLPYDRALVWLDRSVFGVHLNTAWLLALPQHAFSEAMHLFYFSYYPLMIAVPILVAWSGRELLRRESVLRIGVAYLACFFFYALWPTTGPSILGVAFPPSVSAGLAFRINHLIQDAGDSLGTAFPSSHVAGSITMTWVLWRFGHRRLAGLGALISAGVIGATVYTQNHFAVDSLAGLLLACGVQGWLVPKILPRKAGTVLAMVVPEGRPRIHIQPARAA